MARPACCVPVTMVLRNAKPASKALRQGLKPALVLHARPVFHQA
jgi:hypothetical protein